MLIRGIFTQSIAELPYHTCDVIAFFLVEIFKEFFFFFISEHITNIIASLLRNCQATQRQRLLSKFTENDHEKVGN